MWIKLFRVCPAAAHAFWIADYFLDSCTWCTAWYSSGWSSDLFNWNYINTNDYSSMQGLRSCWLRLKSALLQRVALVVSLNMLVGSRSWGNLIRRGNKLLFISNLKARVILGGLQGILLCFSPIRACLFAHLPKRITLAEGERPSSPLHENLTSYAYPKRMVTRKLPVFLPIRACLHAGRVVFVSGDNPTRRAKTQLPLYMKIWQAWVNRWGGYEKACCVYFIRGLFKCW